VRERPLTSAYAGQGPFRCVRPRPAVYGGSCPIRVQVHPLRRMLGGAPAPDDHPGRARKRAERRSRCGPPRWTPASAKPRPLPDVNRSGVQPGTFSRERCGYSAGSSARREAIPNEAAASPPGGQRDVRA
jgi:hypothetical protein